MALRTWRVIERTARFVVTASDGATLLVELPRSATGDPRLADAIERLAPHLEFGDVRTRGPISERTALSGGEHVVIGRVTRGVTSVAYVLASHVPVEVDEIVASYLGDAVGSPFDYLAD
jgi:hypothetical protein